MIKGFIGDWIGLLFLVAIVYILVRPQSKAAQLVDAVGHMLVSIVRRVTDLPAT
jgi:UPF0716 family protein affecting phage T7 exclusion